MAEISDSSKSAVPILCDLDGVVWLMHQPIPGSVDAVAALRARGHRVLFVTNNSSAVIADQEAKLASIGIPSRGDVCTSAQAAGSLLRPGERVLVAGGPGVCEAVEAAGAEIVDHDVETVIVGYHDTFDYWSMTRAATAVRAGARLIGTNDDATYPTPTGPIPGGGAILAAIATAAGVQPLVAGKPYSPMGGYVRKMLQMSDLSAVWMVGDRDSTDGAFARSINARFALVLSGVSNGVAAGESTPDMVCGDLAAFARFLV
ncbi:MAG: HAD-IIA family hydrolase [Ilumatobacteraceae bacterium]